MLLKIREKSQGVFSWVILILICVPFALWGIQNYVGGGTEAAVASVGDREFFQQDVNRAYAQYSQNMAGMDFDEKEVKKQSLDKLIRDEVLLQYVQDKGLVVTDETTREFIQTLEYFQTDGKFDNSTYKALLAAQRISSKEFVNRIKKALVMDQFQRSVVESSFATQKDIDSFFKIQNQTRDIELITVALKKVQEQPTEENIEQYYQKHPQAFLTAEQVAIEYVELSLEQLAKQETPSLEQLQTFYEDNKDRYSKQERRKISHILFAFTKDESDDDQQLQRALQAKELLKSKAFAVVAAEQSDDKGTAKKGGDLGLFTKGVMEEAFEKVATSLKLNEVSDPVKSAFGYHLIQVTELVEGQVEAFEQVKEDVASAVKKSEAEATFYSLSEILTNVSYENPDSLQAVADALDIEIKKTALFAKLNGVSNALQAGADAIISEQVIIDAAFSEDVLKGNNSDPIELGTEKIVVLRMLEHRPVSARQLAEVQSQIIATLINDTAKNVAIETAGKIKTAVESGVSMQTVAKENGLDVKQHLAFARSNRDLGWQVSQAVFSAAKPKDGKSIVVTVADPAGVQTVINLLAVTEGVMSESDKAKQELAETNLAKAFGQADFNAALNSLQERADVSINVVE